MDGILGTLFSGVDIFIREPRYDDDDYEKGEEMC